ncbi:hypothetical protein EUZ85_18980 [Hahella sp. KA22]|uniref:hypothetical protein n=1 Tax=Hahella sp. KA22 TaxID=1628392 RepID=UPI000FDEB378|nr:hypothetical protein [Hahella sp. KA22]AZZ92695.1 hypothetical protein ENC22_16405 [Hahella sp. KA22]QAY56069.1 hypothetical protein EUZ85_18980 [Hahella sp. KA22]
MPDARARISEATRSSTSWFGQLVYGTNKFLAENKVPLSDQSANFVIENARRANEGRIFSSTAHRLEAWHWLREWRKPQDMQLKNAVSSLDPNWYLRGVVLNTAASFWNCIDPASEGPEFAQTGFDPGVDAYNLFKRSAG